MANAPLEYASAGGQGGVLTKRSDMRLYRQAIEGGYNLSPEQRADIVRVAHEIMMARPDVFDGIVQARDQLSAAKVLLAADKMDLEAEKMAREPAAGIVNNTQVNIDARGNQELVAELKKQLTLAEREKLLEQLESGTGGNGNGKH